MGAGGDDDVLRGEAFAAEIQRVRIDEGRAGVEYGGSRVGQQAAINPLQPRDLTVFGCDQRGPVMLFLDDGPTETGGVIGPGAVFAGLHQEFLRDAADVDACATPEPFLRDTNLGAMAGSDARATY